MIYGYIRVSTDKQMNENQQFEIFKSADQHKIRVDEWVEETVSGTRSVKERKLGELLEKVKKGDMIIVTELSRLGRSTMEVMSILQTCSEKKVAVRSLKEGYELDGSINSTFMAMAFSLAAQIEHQLISQRTTQALSRLKHEGKKLGRPAGSRNREGKLTGKEDQIRELLEKKVAVAAIGRILNVNRATVSTFIKHDKKAQQIKK